MITVKDVLQHTHSRWNKRYDIDWYFKYRIDCLNDKNEKKYKLDTPINNAIYFYSGHDSESFIGKNMESMSELVNSMDYWNNSKYYYFEFIAVINGKIYDDLNAKELLEVEYHI